MAELEGDGNAAADHYRFVRDRWERTEDRHFAIPPLQWATTFFATRGTATDARACAHALAQIATTTGNAEALAALAHALGECALLDGDASQAAHHFTHALDLLSRLEIPVARADAGASRRGPGGSGRA